MEVGWPDIQQSPSSFSNFCSSIRQTFIFFINLGYQFKCNPSRPSNDISQRLTPSFCQNNDREWQGTACRWVMLRIPWWRHRSGRATQAALWRSWAAYPSRWSWHPRRLCDGCPACPSGCSKPVTSETSCRSPLIRPMLPKENKHIRLMILHLFTKNTLYN